MTSRSRRLARIHSIDDFRSASRRALPRMVFDYIDGAAGQHETTASENLRALNDVRLIPSGPTDVSTRDPGISLFGKPLSFPLVIGPTGMTSAFFPKGELALARAAGRAGIPYVLANGSSCTLEDAMQKTGDGQKWFQLYMPPQRELAAQWIARLQAVGFPTIELTVDTAVPGLRNRDMRNVFSMPFHWSVGKFFDVASRPAWALRMLRHGLPTPSLMVGGPRGKHRTTSDSVRNRISASLSWDDVKWLRDAWPGKLVIKGLTEISHADTALSVGVDAIVVSNHGGRQIDGAIAPIDVLPAFARRIGGRMPILIDSGFRTGSDIAKAIALGATAVQVGRATLWALSVGGEAGASRAIEILKTEFDNALALCGARTPAELVGRAARRVSWELPERFT